jgi:hypothetical protein
MTFVKTSGSDVVQRMFRPCPSTSPTAFASGCLAIDAPISAIHKTRMHPNAIARLIFSPPS